eukprot:gene5818-biopygen1221
MSCDPRRGSGKAWIHSAPDGIDPGLIRFLCLIMGSALQPPRGKRQRTRTGRGPDAGRTIEFEETDADRTRTGRGRGRFSQRQPWLGEVEGTPEVYAEQVRALGLPQVRLQPSHGLEHGPSTPEAALEGAEAAQALDVVEQSGVEDLAQQAAQCRSHRDPPAFGESAVVGSGRPDRGWRGQETGAGPMCTRPGLPPYQPAAGPACRTRRERAAPGASPQPDLWQPRTLRGCRCGPSKSDTVCGCPPGPQEPPAGRGGRTPAWKPQKPSPHKRGGPRRGPRWIGGSSWRQAAPLPL